MVRVYLILLIDFLLDLERNTKNYEEPCLTRGRNCAFAKSNNSKLAGKESIMLSNLRKNMNKFKRLDFALSSKEWVKIGDLAKKLARS